MTNAIGKAVGRRMSLWPRTIVPTILVLLVVTVPALALASEAPSGPKGSTMGRGEPIPSVSALLHPPLGRVRIGVCLDTSQSMQLEGRYAQAESALRKAIARLRPDDELVLFGFADETRKLYPGKRVIGADALMLPEPSGRWTDPGSCLETALRALESTPGEVTLLLLLSDGKIDVADPNAPYASNGARWDALRAQVGAFPGPLFAAAIGLDDESDTRTLTRAFGDTFWTLAVSELPGRLDKLHGQADAVRLKAMAAETVSNARLDVRPVREPVAVANGVARVRIEVVNPGSLPLTVKPEPLPRTRGASVLRFIPPPLVAPGESATLVVDLQPDKTGGGWSLRSKSVRRIVPIELAPVLQPEPSAELMEMGLPTVVTSKATDLQVAVTMVVPPSTPAWSVVVLLALSAVGFTGWWTLRAARTPRLAGALTGVGGTFARVELRDLGREASVTKAGGVEAGHQPDAAVLIASRRGAPRASFVFSRNGSGAYVCPQGGMPEPITGKPRKLRMGDEIQVEGAQLRWGP